MNLKPFFMEFFKTSISNVQSNNLYKLIPTKLLNSKIHDSSLDVVSIFNAISFIKNKNPQKLNKLMFDKF